MEEGVNTFVTLSMKLQIKPKVVEGKGLHRNDARAPKNMPRHKTDHRTVKMSLMMSLSDFALGCKLL